jgi:glycosyltransferase involved in cell wall biosynthesis
MRVLLDHPNPFLLAHGGLQIQIEQIYKALGGTKDLEVEYLRWWDGRQGADVIHYFGRIPLGYLRAAHAKGIRVVMNQLLTGLGSRSRAMVEGEKAAIALGRLALPPMVSARFAWDSFREADACIANTKWEAHLMSHVFGAPKSRVHVVPNGVEEVFLNNKPKQRGEWLVCTATITERKRVLELAKAAVLARTPLRVIGQAYSNTDPYARNFIAFARAHPRELEYTGPVSDREKLASIYREARGFVLLSTMETRSLAAEEAAACESPLLLSDLPWAKSVFSNTAWYCPVNASVEKTADCLRKFYDTAPNLKPEFKAKTWLEVAGEFRRVYEEVIRNPEQTPCL